MSSSDNEKTVIISSKDRTVCFSKDGIILDETQHKPPVDSIQDLDIILPTEQYEYLGLLGSGGMGNVLRVRDLKLNRIIAMKVLHTHHLTNPIERTRFLEEAQIEAQLQHPSIVSVHEVGILPSKHIYFTMREIRGVPLKHHIEHRENPIEKRVMLLQALRRICEAVGYAHNRGVVHCDIKPSNIMTGSYGEVWLVDWGIARLIHMQQVEHEPVYLIHNEHSFSDDITGTPLYMSPEQASGFNEELKPTSDIYALGVILYQIIVGEYPYPKIPMNALLEKVRYGTILPFPSHKNEHELPSALVEICKKALSFLPKERFQDGQEMALALQEWLDGSKNQEKAHLLIQQGLEREKESLDLLFNLDVEYEAIQVSIQSLKEHGPEQSFHDLWKQEEECTQKRKQSSKKWRQAEQLFISAITYCPDLPQTNLALALFYFRAHKNAQHTHEQERLLEALEKHTYALPFSHPQKNTLLDYITGNGWLTLHTYPQDATVLLEEYTIENRRMIPVHQYTLGTTPLIKISVPMGSYRLRIQKEGFEDVLYPIKINRLQHWDGIPPGKKTSQSIWLPPKGSLSENECYVPAGYFLYGGDKTIDKHQALETIWLDGFIIAQYPFSNRQYITLLNQAYDKQDQDVENIQPRIHTQDGLHVACYGRDEQRYFIIQKDLDGDMWDIDWPVICLTYDSICTAIDIYSQQKQQSYTLPSEEQWEKAARGVDGRLYPWGNHFHNTWTHCSTSKPNVHGPIRIGSYSTDVSPYGVFDMGGNVREATTAIKDGVYITRGGCWHSSGSYNRTNKRVGHKKTRTLGNLGFRIIRSIPDPHV